MGNPLLFVIGDSISIHYGPYLKQGLRGKFEVQRKGERPGEESLDANGRDSNEVVRYINQLVEQGFSCDLLLVNSGLHDIRQVKSGSLQVDPDTYRANLQQIVTLSPSIAPRLFWVTTTPVNDAIHNRLSQEFKRYNADVLRYNEIAQDVMTDAGVPIIDLYRFMSQFDVAENLYEDHVHFEEEIRRLQGEFIAGWFHVHFQLWEP